MPGRFAWMEMKGQQDGVPAPPAFGARLPRLIDVSVDVARVLRELRVAIIGAGSVGSRVVDSLARMGVAEISICDARDTKPESVLTHAIMPSEVGVPKALLAAERAKALSPDTRVRYLCGSFETMARDALSNVPVVVLASDNLACEVAVSQACLHLGALLLQASVYGPALLAEVRAVEGGPSAEGPCLACAFGAAEWEALDAGTIYSCEGSRGGEAAPEPSRVATASLPHLCSTAADLLVGELLRRVLALSKASAESSLLSHSGYTGESVRSPLVRSAGCPLDHAAYRVIVSDRPPGVLSARDIARMAGCDDAELPTASLRIDGYRYSALAGCACDTHPRLGRFFDDEAAAGRCPDCNGPQALHPMYTHATVPLGAMRDGLDRRLGSLGVEDSPPVLFRGPGGSTLVRAPAQVQMASRSRAEPDPPFPSRDVREEVPLP